MKLAIISTVYALCMIISNNAIAQTTKHAPEGYLWVESKHVNGKFLLPKTWHFTEVKRGQNMACFITKEKFYGDLESQPGVVVELVNNLPKMANFSPSVHVKNIIKMISKQNRVIRAIETAEGSLTKYTIEFTKFDKSDKLIHYLVAFLPNDKINIVHTISAQSPDKNWNEYSPTFDKIINIFNIYDTK